MSSLAPFGLKAANTEYPYLHNPVSHPNKLAFGTWLPTGSILLILCLGMEIFFPLLLSCFFFFFPSIYIIGHELYFLFASHEYLISYKHYKGRISVQTPFFIVLDILFLKDFFIQEPWQNKSPFAL